MSLQSEQYYCFRKVLLSTLDNLASNEIFKMVWLRTVKKFKSLKVCEFAIMRYSSFIRLGRLTANVSRGLCLFRAQMESNSAAGALHNADADAGSSCYTEY